MAQSRGTGGRRINAHLEVLEDHSAMVADAIKRLANTTVMVGIPSDQEQPRFDETGGQAKGTEKRTDTQGGIGNANIGYIHETGAPGVNIPARPWLSPGVRNSQRQWEPYMRRAGQLSFAGKTAEADKAWHAAGMTAVTGVKDRIQSNIPPPLSEVTVERRRQRSRGSSYRRAATTASDTTPLIDSGQFINSISYVVRNRSRGGQGEGNT
jgi:hypothetical protein